MKTSQLVLGGLAAAAVAATFGVCAYAGMPFQYLLIDADPMIKLIDFAVLGLFGLVLLFGMVRDAGFLGAARWLAPLVGLLGAACGLFRTGLAMAHTGTTRFDVVAPSVAEALLPLAVGLVAGALAAVMMPSRAPAAA